MARDFSKNTSNYMSLGQNTIGPLINGFRYIMMSAWINYDSADVTANNNRIIQVYIDAANTGLTLSIHNGTSAVVRVGCRSQSADGFQTGSGTTVLSTGTWYQVGGIIDIGGDTIQPYCNGVAEGGGSVTFGAATWTDGTPTAGSEDSISGSISGGVPSNTQNQVDGRIAEVAIWASATAFTAADQAAMAARLSPDMVRRDALKMYLPLLGVDSPERDHWGGLSGTITGTVAAADHPNIIYPSGVISVQKAAAAPVTARGHIIGGGVSGGGACILGA